MRWAWAYVKSIESAMFMCMAYWNAVLLELRLCDTRYTPHSQTNKHVSLYSFPHVTSCKYAEPWQTHSQTCARHTLHIYVVLTPVAPITVRGTLDWEQQVVKTTSTGSELVRMHPYQAAEQPQSQAKDNLFHLFTVQVAKDITISLHTLNVATYIQLIHSPHYCEYPGGNINTNSQVLMRNCEFAWGQFSLEL